MLNGESIFDYLQRAYMARRQLGESIRLPGSTDGEWDGLYMQTAEKDTAEGGQEAMERLAEQLLKCDTLDEADCLVAAAAAQHPAVTVIHDLIPAIARRLDQDSVDVFTDIGLMLMLTSGDIECVKYGLLLCAATTAGTWREEAKSAIRILAVCEEFTLFAVYNMFSWEDSETELLFLGGQVSGWGRIAVVEHLDPQNEISIMPYILISSCNRVSPQYTASLCWEKCDIPQRLETLDSPTEFAFIQGLLDPLTATKELLDELTQNRTALAPLNNFLKASAAYPAWADQTLVSRIQAYLLG